MKLRSIVRQKLQDMGIDPAGKDTTVLHSEAVLVLVACKTPIVETITILYSATF